MFWISKDGLSNYTTILSCEVQPCPWIQTVCIGWSVCAVTFKTVHWSRSSLILFFSGPWAIPDFDSLCCTAWNHLLVKTKSDWTFCEHWSAELQTAVQFAAFPRFFRAQNIDAKRVPRLLYAACCWLPNNDRFTSYMLFCLVNIVFHHVFFAFDHNSSPSPIP